MRRNTTLTVLGLVLIVAGLVLAFLPDQWIEDWLAVEPDGGDGTFEALFALVPLAAGAALLYVPVRSWFVARRAARRNPDALR